MPSLRTFIVRLAEPQLLRVFLERHQLEIDPDVYLSSQSAIIAAVTEALKSSVHGTLGWITSDLERIYPLSSSEGQIAIEEASVELSQLQSSEARALHLFLYDDATFRRAEEIFYANSRRGKVREWTSFVAGKNLDLVADQEALESFRAALRDCFDTLNVHIEVFDRNRDDGADEPDARAALTQVSIYREGRPGTELTFLDGGVLTSQVRRPVLDASLTYEPSTGLVECVAPTRDGRRELAGIFAQQLLGRSPELELPEARQYNLDILRHPLEFATDPNDGIEEVKLAMLRLAPHGETGQRVVVEALNHSRQNIWEICADRLGATALETDYEIHQARIIVGYRVPESNRARSLSLVITHPHKSNLKEQTEVERLIAQKYLRRWQLLAA